MEINKLMIKNFRSYGDNIQTFDITSHPMVMITGKNGSGKSSIVQAILFALYGETSVTRGQREVHKSHLINNSENKNAEVKLIFTVNKRQYEITRSIKAKTGTAGHPRFSEITPELIKTKQSVKTKGATERIHSLVGIDFDSFINSTVITQGQLATLTDAKPAEIKNLLMKMFGLTKYDDYFKEVKKRIKKIEPKVIELTTKIQVLSEDTKNESILKRQLKSSRGKLTKTKSEIEIIKKSLNKLEEERDEINRENERFANIKTNIENLGNEIDERKKELIELNDDLKNIDEAEKELEVIKPKISIFEEIKIKNSKFQEQKEEFTKYNSEKEALEKIIESEKKHLNKDLAEKKEFNFNSKKQVEAKHKEVFELSKEIAEIGNPAEELPKLMTDKNEINTELRQLNREFTKIDVHITSIQDALTALEKTKKTECPVCGNSLSKKSKDERKEHLNNELSIMIIEKGSLDDDIKNKKKTLEDKDKYIQDKESEIDELDKKKEEKIRLNDLIQNMEKDKTIEENELKDLETKISSKNYSFDERSRLVVLDELLKEINYNEIEHKKIKTEFEKLEKLPETIATLSERILRKDAVLEKINDYQEIVNQKNNSLNEMIEEKEALKHIPHKWRSISSKYNTVKKEKTKLDGKWGKINQKITDLRKALRDIKEKKGEINETKSNLKGHNLVLKRLEVLSNAFSKDGIPFIMLKTIMPIVSQKATELLQNLSDLGLELEISMDQDKVLVRVHEGDKSYPVGNYSGGEQIRINFALRLAISEILKNLRGKNVVLDTLIIDEGFSGLDDDGRESLINILNRLSSKYKKIIAISHIKDAQDMFPVQYTIEKQNGFSKVNPP